MRHPYTQDTRRPLLIRHQYWIAPYWMPGHVIKVQITKIHGDGCFYGTVGGIWNKPFGHAQTHYNCAVFTDRSKAERHALNKWKKDIERWTDHPQECAVRRAEMLRIRKTGVADEPVRGENETRFVPNNQRNVYG